MGSEPRNRVKHHLSCRRRRWRIDLNVVSLCGLRGSDMKVVLLGATGFVGSELLKEALDRGHSVTAIVRDPKKRERRVGLIPKTGDVYDTGSVAGLIEGNAALISAFNAGW